MNISVENIELPKDLSKLTAEELDRIAEEKGKSYANPKDGIKTNQMRNVFSNILSIKNQYNRYVTNNLHNDINFDELNRELMLLKPKIAYAVGRASGYSKEKYRDFYNLNKTAIKSVINSENKITAYENYFALMEAIIAYHKYYGGKEN